MISQPKPQNWKAAFSKSEIASNCVEGEAEAEAEGEGEVGRRGEKGGKWGRSTAWSHSQRTQNWSGASGAVPSRSLKHAHRSSPAQLSRTRFTTCGMGHECPFSYWILDI